MKKLTFEIITMMGNPAYMNVMQDGKKLCRFYYNMTGWNQDFFIKNSQGVQLDFGERSATKQQAALKRALKDGFTNIENYPK